MVVDRPGTGNQRLSGAQHMRLIHLPLNPIECGFLQSERYLPYYSYFYAVIYLLPNINRDLYSFAMIGKFYFIDNPLGLC